MISALVPSLVLVLAPGLAQGDPPARGLVRSVQREASAAILAGDLELARDTLQGAIERLDAAAESGSLRRRTLDYELEILEKVLGLDEEQRSRFVESQRLQMAVQGGLRDLRADQVVDDARRAAEILVELLGPGDSTTILARILHGSALRDGGQPDQATEVFDAALVDLRDDRAVGARRALIAHALTEKSRVLQLEERYEEALDLLLDARAIFEESGGDPDLAGSNLNELGQICALAGRHDEGEQWMRATVEHCLKWYGELSQDTAIAINNLAALRMNRGDLHEAEILFGRALTTARQVTGAGSSLVGSMTNNLAVLLRQKGKYHEADELYTQALELLAARLPPDHPRYTRTQANHALVLEALGRSEEAEELARNAYESQLDVFGEGHPGLTPAMGALAATLRQQQRYEEEVELRREVLRILLEVHGEYHPRTATARVNLAGVLYLLGELDEAEANQTKALETRRALLLPDDFDTQRLLMDLAKIHQSRFYEDPYTEEGLRNLDRWISFLEQAAAVYESARLRAGTGLERATFIQTPYRLLAAAQTTRGRHPEAWTSLERGCARAVNDLLLHSAALVDPVAANTEAELRRSIAVAESKLAVLRSDEERAGDRIGETELELLRLETRLAEHLGGEGAESTAAERPYSLEQVRAALGERTALIGWLDGVEDGEGRLVPWIWVVRAGGQGLHWARMSREQRPGDGPLDLRGLRDELAEGARSPTGAVQTRRSREYAHRAWRERIGPAIGALEGIDHLVVVPSKETMGFPVEALIDDGGRFVGERFAVSYAPSATIYARLAERPDDGPVSAAYRALLVGDPPFRSEHLDEMVASVGEGSAPGRLRSGPDPATLERLDRSRDEIEGLAPLFGDSVRLVGGDATEQTLTDLARQDRLTGFGTVHIATHAFVDDQRPERSALVLSQVDLPDAFEAAVRGERTYDGLVTVGEILGEWRLDADLVSLSACETALGRNVAAEGYIGFANAFLQAGARSLLVSLWEVDDEATSILMRRFYQNRTGARTGEPMGKAAALQEARAFLRAWEDEDGVRFFDHPSYWAAFVLIGEAE